VLGVFLGLQVNNWNAARLEAIILKSLKACAVAPVDSEAFQRGVNTLGYINPPRFFRRTVDELAAAGTIDIIRNDKVKEELARIVALVECRGDGFDSTSRMSEHYRFIIEEQVQYDVTRTYADPFLGDFVGMDFDIQALCHNPLTASAVTAISYMTRERQRAYGPMLERYETFLPVLDAELGKR
jgi:hypothetical protein